MISLTTKAERMSANRLYLVPKDGREIILKKI